MKLPSNLIINGDGGSRGNPGEAAYGFAIFDQNGSEIYGEGGKLGITTNNVAEYTAVVKALQFVLTNDPSVESILFRLDSLLVASQMSGKFKIKHPAMRDLFIQAKKLESQLTATVEFTQVPREQNKVADSYVNKALDDKI